MPYTNTKGGWKYRKDVSGKTFYIETVDTGHTKTFIGEIGGGLHTHEEIEANAKLVASAPELLRTCLNALEDVKKLNKQLIQEGKHGYTLMETELSNAIKLALGL